MKERNNRPKKPFIIAGPCSVESREQTLATIRGLAACGRIDMIRGGVWKPRTSPNCFQGVGEEGLAWLAEAKRETGLPFGVEVANARHLEAALQAGADMVWIGTRTTGNPFSVQEVADALRGVDRVMVCVKNAPVADTGLWTGAVERLAAAGVSGERLWLIHRGFAQEVDGAYRNPPAWHVALEMRRRFPQLRMLCDPSHMCGRRELLAQTMQKAADLLYDGLFVESHIAPERALSDAGQQVTPAELCRMLAGICWRSEEAHQPQFEQELERYRLEIDQLDDQLFSLLSRRMRVVERIGRIKRENGVTILQRRRWGEIVENLTGRAAALNLSRDFIRTVLDAIHMESIAHQNRVMNDAEDPAEQR